MNPNRNTMDYGTGVAWVIRTVYDQCFRGQTTLYKHTSKVYHVPTKFSHEKAFCAVKKMQSDLKQRWLSQSELKAGNL